MILAPLSPFCLECSVGPVAQRLEQRTHNPLVLGSNPSGPTNCLSEIPHESNYGQAASGTHFSGSRVNCNLA